MGIPLGHLQKWLLLHLHPQPRPRWHSRPRLLLNKYRISFQILLCHLHRHQLHHRHLHQLHLHKVILLVMRLLIWHLRGWHLQHLRFRLLLRQIYHLRFRWGEILLWGICLGHHLHDPLHQLLLNLRFDGLSLWKKLLLRISLGDRLYLHHRCHLHLRFHHELLSLLISVDQKSYLVIRLTEAQRMCRPI